MFVNPSSHQTHWDNTQSKMRCQCLDILPHLYKGTWNPHVYYFTCCLLVVVCAASSDGDCLLASVIGCLLPSSGYESVVLHVCFDHMFYVKGGLLRELGTITLQDYNNTDDSFSSLMQSCCHFLVGPKKYILCPCVCIYCMYAIIFSQFLSTNDSVPNTR